MPATSIRDLVIHGDDLVVGTHGRGFWILDDISPLREMTAETRLYAPRLTFRYPRNTNTDTPLPPEEPAGQNPPDGAILYYNLKSAPSAPITLEILDTTGKLVRRFSSEDKPEPPDPAINVPAYWIRPFQPLSAAPGMHRFVWDLHAAPAGGGRRRGGEYPISAIYQDTPGAQGEWMPPGVYTVKLTVDGRTYTQPLMVKPDPRKAVNPRLPHAIINSMRTSAALALVFAAALPAQSLAGRSRARIGNFEGTVSLYAKNLDTGESAGIRQAEPVRTASTIKLPILLAVFDQVAAGKAKWTEPLTVTARDKVSGSGIIGSELSDGVQLPLRDVVHLMIVLSDNSATNMILERFTADAVNAYLDKIGIKTTRSMRKVRGDGAELKAAEGWSAAGKLPENQKYGLGVSSPRDMVSILEKLERGEIVSPEASQGNPRHPQTLPRRYRRAPPPRRCHHRQ